MANWKMRGWLGSVAVLTMLLSAFMASAASPKPPSSICLDNVCDASSIAGGETALKWHPGHYVLLDGFAWSTSRQATHFSQMEKLSSNAAIKGFMVKVRWSNLETGRGNYAQGDKILQAYLDKAASLATPKRVMFIVIDRTFGACKGTWSGVIPEYMNAAEFANGIAACAVGSSSSLQSVAKSWEPAVMDRMIALTRHFAEGFDDHPNLEMFGWEGETAVDGYYSALGYTWGGYWTQWKRLISASKSAWTRTQIRLYSNWSSSQSQESAVEAFAASSDVSIGGPDTWAYTGNVWADRVFTGNVWNGSAWTTTGGIDYRGKVPWVAEVQSTAYQGNHGFDSGVTFQQLYDFAFKTMQMSYMVWLQNEWAGTSEQMWPANLAFINAHPTVARTACPGNFPGCDTN